MKRLLPVIACAFLGCGYAANGVEPPRPPPVLTVSIGQEKPIETRGDTWSMTVPFDWEVDTSVHDAEGGMKQVYAATTQAEVGRTTIHADLRTMPWDGPEVAFTLLASQLAVRNLTNVEVLKEQTLEVDGHTAYFVLVSISGGFGLGTLLLASGDTGYVLTCGGDYMASGAHLARVCNEVMQSFHVR